MNRFSKFITGLISNRMALSVLLSLQIVLIKTMRLKKLSLIGCLLIIAHIIGMYLGYCPLHEIKLYWQGFHLFAV
ncbi:MAG TPA: hypothetical protein PL029_06595 [Bacteroidia bacterium]|mgnify:CR=1 FL=1|nr:hypothetical protein [Bacteroidia bacterium]